MMSKKTSPPFKTSHLKIALAVILAGLGSLQTSAAYSVESDASLQTLADSDKTQLNAIDATEDLWGDDNWGDETISPWKFSGFVEAAQGNFLQHNVVKSGASLSELRARFELNYSHEHFEFTAKGDARYDAVLSDTVWDTRELYISTRPLDMLDVKLGRQVLTWGTGDYLFLNDLFPKDWQSFFSGRDDEYLKAPSDSVRTSWYLNGFTLDLAWTPQFTPDKYLTGERFSFYSPLAQASVAPAENFKVNTTDDTQWSARLAKNYHGVEVAFYGSKGFWTTPVGSNEMGVAYFPKMNSLGTSVRLSLAGGLFNAEYVAYNSLEDRDGTNPLLPNGQQRLLLGFETELIKNLTASVQAYIEHTDDYDAFKAASFYPKQVVDENRQLVTLRLRYAAMQQKLIYSLFTFYSPTDSDAYIKPSISYRQNDRWSYALGANIFWGNEAFSFFGQHQDKTNAWLRVRYQS